MAPPATSDSHVPRPLPAFFCPETGIYCSLHPSRRLPADPFLDIVSFIFSHDHRGASALIDAQSGFALPYSELYTAVKSFAHGLLGMGLSKGDVVVTLLPNSVYFPVVFLGALCAGAVVAPMNPLSGLSVTRRRVADLNARLAITSPGRFEALKDTPGFSMIELPEIETSSSSDFSAFRSLLSQNSDQDSVGLPVIRQRDTAAILYSSGTTGFSKAVALTHGNLIAMVELFVKFGAARDGDSGPENVYLAVLPMFHVFGLSLFAVGLLSLGSSIVVMKKFDAVEAVRAIERFKVTHFPVVPFILPALTSRARGAGAKGLGSLKQVLSGAAPLRRKHAEDFIEALPHVDLIQGYGMTETTAVGSRGFNTAADRKYSSVGDLAPNMEAKIVDCEDGSPLPPGRSGELWLRGPSIMKGYLGNREAIDEDGWLHTGDVCCFDEDGYLFILDRLKDIIKYKGFQIAPADLETVLVSHPEIVDAGVAGGEDEIAGEIPVAFVVKKPGSCLSEASVIDYVAEQVPPYQKVRVVVFTQSVPRSAAGKILRRELKNSLISRL